jgi:SAM-dependent methyltransferase
VSQPPPPPASEAAALEITPVLAESEPPTEPFHPAPAPEQDADHAATSYPPPPLPEIHSDEAAAPEPAPTSLKPMRMISLGTSTGPESPAEPVLPPSPVPPPVEATSRVAAIPVVSSEIEEGDISFPADEDDSDSTHSAPESDQLTDDDISPESGERISSEDITPPEILVDLEANEGQPVVQAVPPPPPRRDSGKLVKPVTPPSVVEAKEAQRTKQRKAWWEELFGEDFARANAKLKAAQVTREADFIEESLGVAKGGVMLDLACGGGQHAVELATRGYGVVGYDLSLYQLSVAADVAQDAGQKLNLLQGDMREMAFEEMFDGIYCWNTSFGYFEEEKNIAVAQRVFRALRPGGMFLLDIANRDYVVANQPAQTWFEGDGCVCMDDMSVDFITSRLRVKRSLILDDGRTMECVYSIRLYGLHELGKLLHDVGFRVTEASGHPATPGVFFGASSPRIIILAQRP